MRPFSILLSTVLCLGSVPARAETLCQSKEQTVFSCRIAKSHNVASLCVDGDRLTYRFGTHEKVQEQFPEDVGPAHKFFGRSEYRSDLGFEMTVWFRVGGSLTVVALVEGEEASMGGYVLNSRAATKTLGGRKEQLWCESSPKENWALLNGIVPKSKGRPPQ
ncbi:MAG: hypothetical protein ACHREM_21150 [Polyangiales bacterium]